MIDHENKFIFIHIPKTGGTALSEILLEGGAASIEPDEKYKIGHRKDQSLVHMTFQELSKDLNSSFEDYYKFTIIRNPWDRAVSLWASKFKNKGWSFVQFLNIIENKDQKILDKVFINHNIGRSMIRPQHDFVFINNKNMLDKVYRFEDFENSVEHIKNKLGFEKEIEKINASKRTHYSDYYNEKTKRQIEKIYKKDIITFDYSF